MGMSTHLIGLIPADAKYKKMRAIWENCYEYDIRIPPEVEKYFEGERPDGNGIRVPLKEEDGVTSYVSEGENGFEVELSKLPKDVKFLRFYNSW